MHPDPHNPQYPRHHSQPHAGQQSDEVKRQEQEWRMPEGSPVGYAFLFIFGSVIVFAMWLIWTVIRATSWAVTYFGSGPGMY